MRKDFNYLCLISVDEWYELQIYYYVSCENSARKGLINTVFMEYGSAKYFNLKTIWKGKIKQKSLDIYFHGIQYV